MVKYILIISLLLSGYLQASQGALPDPTKPLNYKVNTAKKQAQPKLPKLQSIYFENAKASAILNNKSYQTGQTINGYLITSIEKDVVLLRYASHSYKLALYTDSERFIN